MRRIIQYLKPFSRTILLIIGLLFIQAMTDLALPDYMSNIVNVGIQQRGVEQPVPEVIRKTRLDQLASFLNDAERQNLRGSYTLLDKTALSSEAYSRYQQQYPLLEKEALYQLKVKDQKSRDALAALLAKPMLLLQAEQAPQEKLAQLPQLPESMVMQAAIAFVQNEYEVIGLDAKQRQSNYILTTGLMMLLIALLGMAASIVVGFLGAKVAAGMAKNLRKKVFAKVVAFSNTEFDRFSTASLITRSTNDIQQIQMMMVMLLRVVFYAPIIGFGGFIKVLNSNVSMTWTIGVAVVAIIIIVLSTFKVAIPKFKVVQQLVDRVNLVTRETLSGILVVRAFRNQAQQNQKFDLANQDLTATNLFVSRLMSLLMPMMMLIMNGVSLLIVWVGAHQIEQGTMQVGNMMAFIQYAMQIIMAFLMISMVSIMFPRALVSAERIGEILDAEIAIRDPEESKTPEPARRGQVEFQQVSFRYAGAEEDALRDISFVAQPGKTTAFIGSTGSGKTTLLNLIPRFYDVTGGRVLVEGVDVREVPQQQLRDAIGYVPQKTLLFSGTIASNLSYGVQSASTEELQQTAKTAQAFDFISNMPEGFEANIAQGGTNVSGGQKQRISIARALLKKPAIYLFDDSFSALDFKTDVALRKALKEEMSESTLLIVAQRISTIMHADQIIVLDEGRIVGRGTHQELMNNCEVYQQITLSQLSKEELAL